MLLKICERNLTDMALRLRSILFQFTVSYMAVLRAWLFVYPTLFSSALWLLLHQRSTRCLWRSCALRFGSDCCWFCQAWCCIPEVRNSQGHRQNRTELSGAGKLIYPSCRRFLLSVQVCTAHRHLDRFLTRFCVLCLPIFSSFLQWIDESILHNLLSRYGGYSYRKISEKIKNFGRIIFWFLSAEGARGKQCRQLKPNLSLLTQKK